MMKIEKHKILVIYGPNMNLLSLKNLEKEQRITLDKISKHIRKTAKNLGYDVMIRQTNHEGRAVDYIQQQRKKIKGLLLFPGPWQQSGHVIKDTLDILLLPHITISLGQKEKIFKNIKSIKEKDIYDSTEKALSYLVQIIQPTLIVSN